MITDATYSLLSGDKQVEYGSCEVEGSEIHALIEPDDVGDYTLEVTYTVAPETRKVRVAIHVS